MNSLQERIPTLSDADAQRILTIFASNQPGYSDSTVTDELIEALRNEPALTSDEQTNAGDMARSALLLLADDTQHGEVLNALVSGSSAQQYGVLETAAIVSAVLFALGTYVKVERDKEGRWAFKVEKQPTDNALLQNLMNKLFGLSDTIR